MFGRMIAFGVVSLLVFPSIAAPDVPAAKKSPADPQIMSFKTVEIHDSDGELRRLLKLRYNAAGEDLRARTTLYKLGRVKFDELAASLQRFTKAGAEVAETPVAKVTELELAHNAALWMEAVVSERFVQEVDPVQIMKHARVVRYDLEIELYRARALVKAAAAK